MRMRYRLTLAGMVLVLGTALPLAAQDTPGQQDVIERLQGKNVLSDEDTAALRAWVEQRVQALAAGDPAGSATAVKDLRGSYKGTPSFKEAYLTACAEVIGGAYKQAKRDAAARLIAVLNTLNEVPTYTVLTEALGDQRVPVRAAAAIGLRNLQSKLAAAGGNAFAESIAALRDAGKREESPVALQLIYRAMDYSGLGSSPDPKANAAAVLALLKSRGQQYGTRNVKAVGADRVGLILAGKLSGQLDDDGRRRLAIATAKMLHYAVMRYTSELHKIQDKTSSPLQIALRNRVELFIEAAEELLVSLTQPTAPPGVTRAMQEQPEGEKTISMKIAMNKWGDLIQERFQIDIHMEVTEDETPEETPEP